MLTLVIFSTLMQVTPPPPTPPPANPAQAAPSQATLTQAAPPQPTPPQPTTPVDVRPAEQLSDPANVIQSIAAVKDWEPAADLASAEWTGIQGVEAAKGSFGQT